MGIHLLMQGTWVHPWSGKIPHVVERLSLWATTTESMKHRHLKPVLHNKRSYHIEKPLHHNWRE